MNVSQDGWGVLLEDRKQPLYKEWKCRKYKVTREGLANKDLEESG